MIERENVEVKVGIFVFIGLLVLFIIVFSIGDFYFWNPGYSIKVLFRYINGVEVSAPVRFAGVNAGEVKEINIVPDSKTRESIVELLLWVQQHVMIPEDSVVTINTLGLLGEKYVEIVPGTSEGNVLKEGDRIRGKDPIATEAIAEDAYAMISKLEQAIDHVNEILQDPRVKSSFKETVINTAEATGSAKDILSQIRSGQGTLGKLIYQETVHENLEDLTTDLKTHPWKLLQKPKEQKEKKK